MNTHHRPLALGESPVLGQSPVAAPEIVDRHDFSDEDRAYLREREKTIEAGRCAFLEVGKALIEIKQYRDGLLYKRHGTFERYCQARWEFGRSYASRIIGATQVYLEMLPRGNNLADGDRPLPTTEKQIRALKKLPPASRLEAWNEAVEAAGARPVVARDVEKQVRKRMVHEASKPAPDNSEQAGAARPSYQISADHLGMIRSELAKIRGWTRGVAQAEKIAAALERIETLLPA